jgi:uncharacterized membrane protein
MSFVIFGAWIVLNASLVNVSMKIGWNHDPGYMAPFILVTLFNVHSALYAATRNRITENS